MRKSRVKQIVRQAITSAIKDAASGSDSVLTDDQVDRFYQLSTSLAEIMRGSTTNNVVASLDTIIGEFKAYRDENLDDAADQLAKAIQAINNAQRSMALFEQRNIIEA